MMYDENFSPARQSGEMGNMSPQSSEEDTTEIMETASYAVRFRRQYGIPLQFDALDAIVIHPPMGEHKYFVVDESDVREILEFLKDSLDETVSVNSGSVANLVAGRDASFVSTNLHWAPSVHSEQPIETYAIDTLNLEYMLGKIQKLFESKFRSANRLPT
jgi:hypothetical protein